jgi:citrate lyase subunit beta / citryl-CoA lyase
VPYRKPAARSVTPAYLEQRSSGTGPQCFVRVNGFPSSLVLDDLAAVLAGRPDGIVVIFPRGVRQPLKSS